MTTMNLEIYDALIQAKFPEKPARTIAVVLDKATKKEAEEVKTDLKTDIKEVKEDIAKLDKEITVVKWMLGVVLVAVVIPILQNIFGF